MSRKLNRQQQKDRAWARYRWATPKGAFPSAAHAAKQEPVRIRQLHAHNEFNQGIANFTLRDGFWCCTQADKPLQFLLKLDGAAAKMALAHRGYEWHWRDNPSHFSTPAPAVKIAGQVRPCSCTTGLPATAADNQTAPAQQQLEACGSEIKAPPARVAENAGFMAAALPLRTPTASLPPLCDGRVFQSF